ncbi:unnamed protein product (macronuclear) [Paramecium tetraurelia]|uniref:Uncharacterized protein n=1 Tax=Paramecium tetraurelia TaxID=5888 RepID=A0EF63_PARTE|nr:uncharacterized protein GSPATT00026277001 [Paramecium tetraurelia]CAK93954.1 unnamed protein product [Paramecium tetraurelia]|eukprot:XP_001461327.1 hypothetical protein (macronuclear) [Paramecium tetraurelia strain d4-2]
MIIKEWAKQQSYLEWWGLNKQDHNLHFLITCKSVTDSSDQIYEKVILQKPSCNLKIYQTINSLKYKKENDDLLKAFLQTNLTQISFGLLADMLQEPQKNQLVELEVQEDIESIQVDNEPNGIRTTMRKNQKPIRKVNRTINKQFFNIKILDLTLQLIKDDYF